VLLIDTSQATRELRAEVMRKLDIDVDCAADIAEARSWWRAALYDLVVINIEKEHVNRDKFCDDVRSATPPQRLAFLVGGPQYLADSPRIDEEIPADQNASDQIPEDPKVVLGADRGDLSQHWGILEASRRIAAVRSAALSRTRAMRALPAPPRDSEDRSSHRATTPTSLDALLKEELQ
jgi:CheY-like chemotaxis protein